MWFSDTFASTLTAVVAEAEAETDVELVVVVQRSSASGLDVALMAGIATALATLGFLLFSPWDFDPLFIPGLVVAGGALGFVPSRVSGTITHALTRPSRRHEQVQDAADAAFYQQVVHGTRGRTGLLIYVSVDEREVALRPDLGLQGRIPVALLNGLDFGDGPRLTTPEAFVQGLRGLGVLLAERVPALDDNPNEIPDEPRFYP